MKKCILAATAALSLAAALPAFAGASLSPRATDSNGSAVGQSSSSYTGNGDVIGGNGTSNGAGDQTTAPASRPSLMQSYGVFNGKGNAGDNAGGVGNQGVGGGHLR